VANPPSCLIHGPTGAGKRTVVRCLSEVVGIPFAEINVSDEPDFVRQRLFGSREEAESAPESAFAPGECGAENGAILFLSGFENLHGSLLQDIQQLLTARSYIDATGYRWKLAASTWVIASLRLIESVTPSVRLPLDHWLCATFDHVVKLDSCERIEGFRTICHSLAAQHGCALESEIDNECYQLMQHAPGRLHSVRRWIANAALSCEEGGVISREDLLREMSGDIKVMLRRLTFRGHVVEIEAYEKWAQQFGDRKHIAYHIVRCICDSYYISSAEYHRAVQHIVQRFGIPRRASVTFCKWQAEGRSAPRVAHVMKNQAYWRVEDDTDIKLSGDRDDLAMLNPSQEHFLIVVDDFVGSGGTLSRLFEGADAPIPRLLESLPLARVFIGIVAGFRDAFQKIIERLGDDRGRVILVPYKVFDEEDRCFSETSRIFPNAAERDELRDFCIAIARDHFPGLRGRHRLGYSGTAALVVFPDTVPNNSLPVLWYDSSSWHPLFPASGLPSVMDVEPTDNRSGA